MRPREEIDLDLARLRAVVGAAVEGIDVDVVFAAAPLCAAVDACRPALSAAAEAAPDTARVLTRVCRLELLELLERDLVVWELPAGTPAALRAALAALRAALQASPELERAHCATAVAAEAAEPPSDGWTLNFLRAENGPACPVPCEGALVIAFRPFLQAGSAPAVLGRLMPAIAAAAGQPASSVRMPRDGGRLHDEEDDEDDEDEDDFGAVCAAVMAPNGFQPLIRVVARDTSSRGRQEYTITVFPGAGVAAAAVCEAARAAAHLHPGDEDSLRCDVLPHGTVWRDVAAPAAWDAATAPRLTLRVVTGTERGSADGPLATRFDLYAEAAPPPREAKRQRSAAAGGKERVGRALLTYYNGEMGVRGPTLELLDVKERWQRRGVGTALLSTVEGFIIDAVSPRPLRNAVLLQLCDAAMARQFFEATGFIWLDPPVCEEGSKELFAPPRCTCGTCSAGIVSEAFATKFVTQADMYQDSLQEALDELGPGTEPLTAEQVEQIDYYTTGMASCLAVVQGDITRSMLAALRYALQALIACGNARELPTPAAVLARWPAADPAAIAGRELLFSRGCSLAHIIGYILDVIKHLDGDGEFDYLREDSDATAQCENDHAFDAVRIAALGAAFPARFPGCVDCGAG